jgi:hypothetical protein
MIFSPSEILPVVEATRFKAEVIEKVLHLLNLLLDKGKIVPSLLTSDKDLMARISRQPLLEWKALNVREYKGK